MPAPAPNIAQLEGSGIATATRDPFVRKFDVSNIVPGAKEAPAKLKSAAGLNPAALIVPQSTRSKLIPGWITKPLIVLIAIVPSRVRSPATFNLSKEAALAISNRVLAAAPNERLEPKLAVPT